jgi:hypothetical protein
MNVLFYSRVKEGVGERLQHAIERLSNQGKIEVHRTIASLTRSLCRPAIGQFVAVLLAASKEELLGLLSIRDLLLDKRVILLLPDRNEDTIVKGHTLYPRFLSYSDDNMDYVAGVLEKMLQKRVSCNN